MIRPSLIIVSGPPAAGKTRLARKLGLPLLQKDVIKERIADRLGDSAGGASGAMGLAAIRILLSTTLELVANGQSVVIESFFTRGRLKPTSCRCSSSRTPAWSMSPPTNRC